MFTKLTEKLDSFLENHTPWYDCAVYHKGECVYRHQNGYLDLEKTRPATGNEYYNIFSCSKVITCTAALMLYERGIIRLEDKLSDYLPEFETMNVSVKGVGTKRAKNAITLKHLFCMTAGFSYNLWSPMLKLCREETGGVCKTRDVMKYLAKEPLLFEPGEGWAYSLCHDVLAAVVEVASGMEFNEFCKKNIFEPLGMKDTTYLLPKEDYARVSPMYSYKADIDALVEYEDRMPAYRFGLEHASGGAGCASTVDDYMKFLEGLRTYKLLKRETVDLMETHQLTAEQFANYNMSKGYGYGLGVRCSRGDDGITDFGWGGAAGAYLLVDRKNEITAFYAQHVTSSPVQLLRAEITTIIQDILK